jgi:hypothetical protein
MTRYLILMTTAGDAFERLTHAQQAAVFRKHEEFERALRREGKLVSSGRLAPAADARTVTLQADGRSVVNDGPFAETKEVLGGFYLIEAESLAEAVEWARRGRFIPGSNEVRPLLE